MLISLESIQALELPSLLRLVAEGAASDAGYREIVALEPSSDTDELAVGAERGREVERLLEDGSLVGSMEEPLLPLFENLTHGQAGFDGIELVGIRNMLRVTLAAVSRIREAEPGCRSLLVLADEVPDLSDLIGRLERDLDDRGRIRDSASPRLATLRRQAQRARQSTYTKLEKYVRGHAEELAEDTVPLHEERLVVLLRSGSKGRLPGLVHGRSGSGQSYYFEPLEVVESNNELRTAQAEEEAERRRILIELIDLTRGELDALKSHLAFLAELDLRQAAVRWGQVCRGVWIVPDDGHEYSLAEARHPLLEPSLAELRQRILGQSGHAGEVVPLTVELEESGRLLVITGPNAGGKTVALKTLGLIALAAHCGLPVPVGAETRIPRLEGIVASVGDEQDLLADRSTFSGRLLRLKEAWDLAGPRTLILLDELGSGTDPEEGAALGVALLEGLVERGAFAAVSSHLTRLAAAALDLEGAACAAMAFDTESGLPTYRLLPGTPGGSEALALARWLELPRPWLARAEDLLGPDHGRLQDLLAEVEGVRQELAGELAAASALRRRLDSELEASKAARLELEEAQKKAAAVAQRAVGDLRRRVRKRLRDEVEELKSKIESGRRRGLASEAVERIFHDAPRAEPERTGAPIEVGSRVRHLGLGWEGTVKELGQGRAEVTVAGKRMVCRVEDLDGLGRETEEPRHGARGVSVSTPGSGELPPKELHLRGERVEEALEKLDRYLDRIVLAGIPEARIVHGHGSGRLKAAVRKALGRHPVVAKWRPGGRHEGGDGATVVQLGS